MRPQRQRHGIKKTEWRVLYNITGASLHRFPLTSFRYHLSLEIRGLNATTRGIVGLIAGTNLHISTVFQLEVGWCGKFPSRCYIYWF